MSTGIRHFPEHIPKHADCQTVKVWPGHLAAEKVNSWSAALFIPILKHGYISNLEKMWRFQVCELAPSLSCLHTTNCQKLRHLDVQQPSDNSFDPSTSPLLSTCNTDEEGGRGGEKLEYIRWKRRCLFWRCSHRASSSLLSDRPKIWHKCIHLLLLLLLLQWSDKKKTKTEIRRRSLCGWVCCWPKVKSLRRLEDVFLLGTSKLRRLDWGYVKWWENCSSRKTSPTVR